MKEELNAKQKLAVTKMNNAFKELKKVGIHVCGMDDGLLFVSVDAIKEMSKKDPKIGFNYNPVADSFMLLQYERDGRCGTFKTYGVYIDSGGW